MNIVAMTYACAYVYLGDHAYVYLGDHAHVYLGDHAYVYLGDQQAIIGKQNTIKVHIIILSWTRSLKLLVYLCSTSALKIVMYFIGS